MRNLSIILCLLLMSGCKTSGSRKPVSHFDAAIENLSITAGQLDSVRKEKDFFVKVLEDFEQQRGEYGKFLGPARLRDQIQDFNEWHSDVFQRERNLEVRYNLDVLAAHKQVTKHRATAAPAKNKIVLIKPKP